MKYPVSLQRGMPIMYVNCMSTFSGKMTTSHHPWMLDIDKKLKKLTGVYTELTEEDEEQNLSEYETYLDSGNRKNKNTGENDDEQSE